MLQKQPININFVQGMDTKTDPYQIPLGKFPLLKNTVFSTTNRLTKRSGFDNITNLPNSNQTVLTTLNDNLIATGSNLYTFNQETNIWLDEGRIQPVQLDVESLVRNSYSQSAPDIAVSTNGLSCLVYDDTSGVAYYQVLDSITGQQVIQRTALPATSSQGRVFILGAYFIITFIDVIAATPTLQYIAINIADPTTIGPATNISADLNSSTTGYDGYVFNNNLYLAWGASAAAVKIAFLSRSLNVSTTATIAGVTADLMSVTADTVNSRIYISYWETGGNNGYSASFTTALSPVMTATPIITAIDIREITSIVISGILQVYYENINIYTYAPNASSDFVSKLTVTPPVSPPGVGTASAPTVVLRSVGLASKPFIATDGSVYFMVAYGNVNQSPSTNDSNQPTYFLIDTSGIIYMKIAYSNGGGYKTDQILPTISVIDETYYFPYEITDFLTTVNKGTALPAGTPVNAIYTQTGINLAKFQINTGKQYSSEIAGALHLTGGQLWEYDTIKPVEHSFHVWPENVAVTTSAAGGNITAQTYFYVFTYEWTDNAGNLQRSAPSIPVKIVTTGSTSTNTLNVPTLRVTAKTSSNPVRIVGYRYSTAQQIYYQFTSQTNPTLSSTTIDSVTITDTLADSAILGTTVLYTTGGVLENIGAPASIDIALFDNRAVIIDAEDRNLLWYSKQVIQNVPVEFSDLLTIFVAPTTGAQGSTGPMYALSAMDDKLIIFKQNAIYYINGNGPDNTGANSTYSQPTFITGAVGSTNPNSVVLMPLGVMFQSDKGIWLLGRDLSTKYIGDAVEEFNSETVMSSEIIPGTTQVRFVLGNGLTLMYDYYYSQWGVHSNVKAISATLYQGKHTYLNSYGQVFQENLESFKDGSMPVLISFVTSWINIAGLQGFERFYFAYFLGTTYTPFKLNVQIAYDYNPSPSQNVIVLPIDNIDGVWGSEAVWGSGGNWGGSNGNVLTARLFPERQKCQSFQLTVQEIFDPSYGTEPGQGLSLSGLTIVTGIKRGYRSQRAAKSFG